MSGARTASGRVGLCKDAAVVGANSISGSDSGGVPATEFSSVAGGGALIGNPMLAAEQLVMQAFLIPYSLRLVVVTQNVVHRQSWQERQQHLECTLKFH